MITLTAQQIFANIVWTTQDTRTRLAIFDAIENNLEKINRMINESLAKGETEFQFDETKFLQ